MKKMSLCIITVLIVLTGCGNERNSIETISLSDRESHLANALAEITFAYELEHKNLENPHLNIWVEEYNYGEKQEEDLLSHGLVRTEKSENEHLYFLIQETGEESEKRTMSIIRIDGENTGSSSSMYDVILDKEGIDAWTYNNEINDADFSNQQAVVIGIIQYADVNTNITGFIPEVINDGSRSAEEVFKDNPVTYLLKAQFSSEYRD